MALKQRKSKAGGFLRAQRGAEAVCVGCVFEALCENVSYCLRLEVRSKLCVFMHAHKIVGPLVAEYGTICTLLDDTVPLQWHRPFCIQDSRSYISHRALRLM
ncbi:hypothetical protein AMECASPLE_038611 [Ameca splendens]|uniref:Uncharacterized protein n=1 Tax=Ameca splendens TaxID=208324 RepID=A0ABV1AHZ8_9TELE